ncbi:hypothetical protein SAMN06265219_105103 [Gracilimonas mengyeensis]|uniref:Uncharacterized protein n=1 Tax=Gracilimonas mengyeensis TaxID=1302730 RepID=A0A521CFB4_9BACT|nr:hypothetical protein SAMN06265219_105103 [Gracilimonas mengyeensis]
MNNVHLNEIERRLLLSSGRTNIKPQDTDKQNLVAFMFWGLDNI